MSKSKNRFSGLVSLLTAIAWPPEAKTTREYTLPAHSNLVSQVKDEPQEGYFLATASYDTKAMVWSGQDFKPIKTLAGHEAKVIGLDIRGDEQQIVTVAHDRTIKIWSCRSGEKENDNSAPLAS